VQVHHGRLPPVDQVRELVGEPLLPKRVGRDVDDELQGVFVAALFFRRRGGCRQRRASDTAAPAAAPASSTATSCARHGLGFGCVEKGTVGGG
jgi:hypothetical protein